MWQVALRASRACARDFTHAFPWPTDKAPCWCAFFFDGSGDDPNTLHRTKSTARLCTKASLVPASSVSEHASWWLPAIPLAFWLFGVWQFPNFSPTKSEAHFSAAKSEGRQPQTCAFQDPHPIPNFPSGDHLPALQGVGCRPYDHDEKLRF